MFADWWGLYLWDVCMTFMSYACMFFFSSSVFSSSVVLMRFGLVWLFVLFAAGVYEWGWWMCIWAGGPTLVWGS
jgi:hypothetical protein